MNLPAGVKISRVQALRADRDLNYQQTGASIEFVIPQVEDYEVAALG